jgi:hypothetical protein
MRKAVCEVAARIVDLMQTHDLSCLSVPNYGRLSVSQNGNGYGDHWVELNRTDKEFSEECYQCSGNLLRNSDFHHPGQWEHAANRQEALRFALALDRILGALDEATKRRESQATSAEKAMETACNSGSI